MDYEKKYNEALAWMRELYPGLHGATKEDAEHYFPELRESEDERVIRTLFSLCVDHDWFNGATKEECLAWLEKQKEQKPAEWSEKDKKMIEYIIGSLVSLKDYVQDNISFSESIKDGILKRIELEQAWLKSLRPSWKPSEEQMEALKHYVDTTTDGEIDLLYNDLKKL